MRLLAGRLHPQRLRRTAGAAACVTEPGRFIARELRRTPTVGVYHLRESGLLAHIRHPLLDMWVLEEIFRHRAYDPPPEVTRTLSELGRPAEIADLGGHVGLFGLFMCGALPHCRILSFEPDPDSAAILRRSLTANRLEDRWRLVEACAGAAEGTAELYASFHLSKVSSGSDPALEQLHSGIQSVFPFLRDTPLVNPRRHRVPVRDVFPFLTGSDLIKIDVEGSEWELLDDHRFRALEATSIVLEYHPAYCPGGDPEQRVSRALAEAGYRIGAWVRGADAGLVWAWKDASGV